jgi:Transcriptional regulator, AbiEi antitoxin
MTARRIRRLTGVHNTEPLPAAAITWAERQAGVLTRPQSISFGLHDSQVARLVRQQVVRRLDRGIYILGVLEPTWHQYAWAAALLGGRSARLIGASAAVFHGLADPRLPIQLGVDSTSGLASRQWLTVFRQRAETRPFRFLASPPRTLIEDTVLDALLGCSRIALVNPLPSSSSVRRRAISDARSLVPQQQTKPP